MLLVLLFLYTILPLIAGADFGPGNQIHVTPKTIGGVRNSQLFPPCMDDGDCEKISMEKETDFRCFQYMCFPWMNTSMHNGFSTCRKDKDCGEEEECFTHQTIREVTRGICLHQNENEECSQHPDCAEDLKCVNGYCGSPQYLNILGQQSCTQNERCQGLLFSSCCYDFSGEEHSWINSENITRRCCDSSHEIIPPKEFRNEEHKQKMENSLLAVFKNPFLFCESFTLMSYEFDVCKDIEYASSGIKLNYNVHSFYLYYVIYALFSLQF